MTGGASSGLRECKHCGEPFMPYKPNAEHCSGKCRTAEWRIRQSARAAAAVAEAKRKDREAMEAARHAQEAPQKRKRGRPRKHPLPV
jgi:hypothetical protein